MRSFKPLLGVEIFYRLINFNDILENLAHCFKWSPIGAFLLASTQSFSTVPSHMGSSSRVSMLQLLPLERDERSGLTDLRCAKLRDVTGRNGCYNHASIWLDLNTSLASNSVSPKDRLLAVGILSGAKSWGLALLLSILTSRRPVTECICAGDESPGCDVIRSRNMTFGIKPDALSHASKRKSDDASGSGIHPFIWVAYCSLPVPSSIPACRPGTSDNEHS
ncbi:hypothetical protein CC79DRAFT_423336 [Sarocladium strictum]